MFFSVSLVDKLLCSDRQRSTPHVSHFYRPLVSSETCHLCPRAGDGVNHQQFTFRVDSLQDTAGRRVSLCTHRLSFAYTRDTLWGFLSKKKKKKKLWEEFSQWGKNKILQHDWVNYHICNNSRGVRFGENLDPNADKSDERHKATYYTR